MTSLVEKIEKVAVRIYSDDWSHGWAHADEVRRYALKLQETYGGDREFVEIVALLHDCDQSDRSKHAENSAVQAKKLLNEFGYAKTDRAVELIENHMKPWQGKCAAKTIEEKLLFDADKLCVISAKGVLRLAEIAIGKGKLDIEKLISIYQVGEDTYLPDSKELCLGEEYLATKKFIEFLARDFGCKLK
ncbi:MAG: HD domain-containing protein [Candidatus Micrarchaeia archaeon]